MGGVGMTIRRFVRALALAGMLPALMLPAGASQGEPMVTKYGFYLDTVVAVSAYADEAVVEGALALCGDYEAILGKTREGSDVWNINRSAGEPVVVSDATLDILRLAAEVGEKTGGAFDITVAPAVALWDFSGTGARLPDAEALRQAAERIDYRKVEIDGSAVRLPDGMQIDLGGIAKGYIADRIADYLEQNGVKSGLLNLGGNILTVGSKPGGSWKVGIQDPFGATGEAKIAIFANDTSIVTSGVYERGFDLNGVRYHHLLDAQTGWPVQNGLASVTIITKESVLADALSTGAFALGLADGMALVESLDGVEAIFITDRGEVALSSGAAGMVAR